MADPISGWATITLTDQTTLAGVVSEVTVAGAPMLKIEVPVSEDGFRTELRNMVEVSSIKPCSEVVARSLAADRMRYIPPIDPPSDYQPI